jgi:hypothetical protein
MRAALIPFQKNFLFTRTRMLSAKRRIIFKFLFK